MMLKVIAIATIVLVASVTSETEFGSRIPEHELAQQEETPKSALIEAEVPCRSVPCRSVCTESVVA